MSQKRPNGSKAPQKGSEKTTWLAFLKKFDVFSTISSFCIVLASIWLLLALIGSCWLLLAPLGSYCLLFAPIASYCLLLPPRCSYCLLLAPNGSSWLLMPPIAHLVSYWLLLVPIRSYCLLLAPKGSSCSCCLLLAPIASPWLLLVPIGSSLYFPQKKKSALPVHLLRQVTGSAGTAMDVLVTCFSKMGGGSGRRGCKSSAQSVISVPLTELFFNTRFFFPPFLQMSPKHSACHTFRASGHLRWAPFRYSFRSVFSMFFQVFAE